jgi:hypothetical protein
MFVFGLAIRGLAAQPDSQHADSLPNRVTGSRQSFLSLLVGDASDPMWVCTSEVTEEVQKQGITDSEEVMAHVYGTCCARVVGTDFQCSRVSLLCDMWSHKTLLNSNLTKIAEMACSDFCGELGNKLSVCSGWNSTEETVTVLSAGATVGICFGVTIFFTLVGVLIVYFVLLPKAIKANVDP